MLLFCSSMLLFVVGLAFLEKFLPGGGIFTKVPPLSLFFCATLSIIDGVAPPLWYVTVTVCVGGVDDVAKIERNQLRMFYRLMPIFSTTLLQSHYPVAQ